MSGAETHLANDLDTLHEELFNLIRIPSISTEPDHAADVRAAADWVAARMRRAGLEAAVEPTAGHPLVIGRNAEPVPGAPTLLVYAHYDVQPAEPLDEWHSPPFEPSVRDGVLFARGAADDKAQVMLQIAAAAAAIRGGGLPLNLILAFEGEEEIGSPNLIPYLYDHRAELAADYAVIADSMMFGPGRPSLIFGMRGMAYFEMEVRIGAHDLHSGQYGGAVPNAANVLSAIIASLHDSDGSIAVDGIYDDVAEAPAAVREEWHKMGFDEAAYRAGAGNATLTGEPGFSTLERLWIRPSIDVNGMISGYTGTGKKTVLPCHARAKLSCRLVADQDPERVAGLLEAYVRKVTPPGVDVSIELVQSNRPWRMDPESPLFHSAATALEDVFGVPPVRTLSGGTLPIAPDLRDALGATVMTMGFALPGANMHAPNEWFPMDHFHRGARAMLRLYSELAATV